MMRIGVVTTWYARGSAVVSKQVAKAFEGYGYETAVYVRRELDRLDQSGEWSHQNITVGAPGDSAYLDIYNWVRKNGLDVVWFTEEHDWSLVAGARIAGARVVCYANGDQVLENERACYASADLVVAPNRYTASLFAGYVNKDKILCPGWGVYLDEFKPSDRQPEFDFVHFAGWSGHRRKNTISVVEAFKQLSGDETLLIHSQMPMNLDVRHPNITVVVGNFTPDEGWPAYWAGRVVVQPSLHEGNGLQQQEALACGKPVVTTDAPVMDEIVNDAALGALAQVDKARSRKGYLTPEHWVDIRSLAECMSSALRDSANDIYAARRASIVQNTRDFSMTGHVLVNTVSELP